MTAALPPLISSACRELQIPGSGVAAITAQTWRQT